MCETYAISTSKTIATYIWKQMKHFEQTLATCATSPDLLLQHQNRTIAAYL
jgi:hypothetical protein